jgi:hypothetical protein
MVELYLVENLEDDHFEHKGFLKPPPTMLLAALVALRVDHNLDGGRVLAILEDNILIW